MSWIWRGLRGGEAGIIEEGIGGEIGAEIEEGTGAEIGRGRGEIEKKEERVLGAAG